MSTPAYAARAPRHVIELGSPHYPQLLAQTSDPPKVLYVLGNPAALRPGLAIVGARKATPYGRSCAQLFGGLAAARGIPVISGGAVGCDQAAQRAALDAGGCVCAVLGCGADVCYPKSNCDLFAKIIDSGGAIVSEQVWGAEPRRYMFVRRNRIIAGLAHATLIVEAGLPSGTFSTADAALEEGRSVLAVPGSVFSPESRGSNRLLVQGAAPVVDEETFLAALYEPFGLMLQSPLAELGPPVPDEADEAGGARSRDLWILRALSADAMRPDALARALGCDLTAAMRQLTRLEAQGLVERYRDGRYGPKVDARIAAVIEGARA